MLTALLLALLALVIILGYFLVDASGDVKRLRAINRDLDRYCDLERQRHGRVLDNTVANAKARLSEKEVELSQVRASFSAERMEYVRRINSAVDAFAKANERAGKILAAYQKLNEFCKVQDRTLQEAIQEKTKRLSQVLQLEEANRLCQVRIVELVDTIGELRAHQVAYMAPSRKRKSTKKGKK